MHPLLFIGIASGTNLGLDLLFTGLFRWGVAGAALATIMGQGISFLFSMIFLYRRREAFHFDFKRESWAIQKSNLIPILTQGIPLSISSSAIYLSMFYVNSMINSLGVIASATFGVGLKIDDICNKISVAIRYAASPMVAQNYAAGDVKRSMSIVRWSWIYGGIFHGVFIAIYLLFGRQLFACFTRDPDVLALAPVFISAIIWSFIPMAFLRGINAFIQGIGNARLSMVLGILDGVVFRVGLSYGFGVLAGMGFYGFVLGYGLAVLGSAIPGSLYILSGLWKKRSALVKRL